MTDDIPRAVKKARKVAVDEFQQLVQLKNNALLVGTQMDVLIEGRKRGRMHGRSRGDKLIYLNTPVDGSKPDPQPGNTVQVEITDSSPWSLESELVSTTSMTTRNKEKVPVV
jgi:tRNA A37 methylthiotransferase MiaB